MTQWFDSLSNSVRKKEGLSAERQLPTLEELATAIERGFVWEELERAEFRERLDTLFKAYLKPPAPRVQTRHPAIVLEPPRHVAFIEYYLGRVISPDAPRPAYARTQSLVPQIMDAMTQLDTIAQEFHTSIKHPLAPLIAGWVPTYRPAPEEKRRMLPGRLAMANGDDMRVPKLYSPRAYIAPRSDGQMDILPGFGDVKRPKIALPLELWRMGNGPEVTPGRGAPWSLRMFVGALLAAPVAARQGFGPVDISMTLRDLIKWLYPNSDRKGASQWWPQFRRAVEELESQGNRIPIYRADTGTWQAVRVVSVSEHPLAPSELDGPVVFRVDLPRGSEAGPKVSPRLLAWGAENATAFRLLLNLAYYWHKPGQSLRKVGKRLDGQGAFWLPSSNPKYYDLLSDDDLIAYAFPISATKNRRVLKQRMNKALSTLAIKGELRIIEDKILPPSPYAALV